MAVSTASIMATIWVMYVNHSVAGRPPRWLRNMMFNYCAKILRMKSHVPVVEESSNKVVDSNSQMTGSTIRICVSSAAEKNMNNMEKVTNKSLEELNTTEKILAALVENQNSQSEGEESVTEWRAIARVMDRLFFWVFTTIAFLGIISLLINAVIYG